MATPLHMYTGAVKFLQASARLQPADKVANAAVVQWQRIIESLGKMPFDQDGATELLEKLAETWHDIQ